MQGHLQPGLEVMPIISARMHGSNLTNKDTKSYRRVKEDMLLYDHRTLQDDSAVGEHCMDIMGNPVYFIFIFTLIKE